MDEITKPIQRNLMAPAELEIVDDMNVILRSGKLRAEVPAPARGFSVISPSIELVDLGTEFEISVGSTSTFVRVVDGEVELYDTDSDRDEQTRRALTKGEAIVVDAGGTSQAVEATEHKEIFVNADRLSEIYRIEQQSSLKSWRNFHDSLRTDDRVVAGFSFERVDSDRKLVGIGRGGKPLVGAIVGCNWTEGRWPGKDALEFKSPGDRVRLNIPGEFDSFTWTAWVRIDALDRLFSSLLLTDGFDPMRPHWQLHRDGALVLGVQHDAQTKQDYESESFLDVFKLGQWIHIATVYDSKAGEVRHYINGRHSKTLPLMKRGNPKLTLGNITIGNWMDASIRNNRVRSLNGRIDELILYSKALTEDDVREVFGT